MANFLKYGERNTTHHTTQNMRKGGNGWLAMKIEIGFIAAQFFSVLWRRPPDQRGGAGSCRATLQSFVEVRL